MCKYFFWEWLGTEQATSQFRYRWSPSSTSVYGATGTRLTHDDVIKWNHFPRYWPFVRGIHRSPVNSPHKGQWRRVLIFSLICAWINGWVNSREAGDLRRHLQCSLYWRHCNERAWTRNITSCVIHEIDIPCYIIPQTICIHILVYNTRIENIYNVQRVVLCAWTK